MREYSQSKKATVNEGRIVLRCARIGQRLFPCLVIAIRGTGSRNIGNELVECRFAFWEFDGDQRLFSRIASSSISIMHVKMSYALSLKQKIPIIFMHMMMSRSAYVICYMVPR